MATKRSDNNMADNDEESFIARRTESVDAEGVEKLIRRSTEAIFGRINVDHLIEHSNFSVSLVSGGDSDEVLAVLSLLDYPSPHGSTVDPSSWEKWLHSTFDWPKASPVNCLFLHLFVAKEGYHQSAVAELLRTAFVSLPLLQYIFLSFPADTHLGPILSLHFTQVPQLSSEEGTELPIQLWVTQRHQHFPALHIRVARVEDADDLMPIFQQCSATDVHQQYGEYFLAELIESQDSHHKTIVAEVEGHAIGFMSVSCEVDVDFLTSCYQLESFHGLKQPLDSDEVQTVSTEETRTVSSLTLLSSSGKSFAPSSEERGGSSKSSCHGDHSGEEASPVNEGGSLSDMTEPKLTQSQPRIIQSGLLTSASGASVSNETGEAHKGDSTPPTGAEHAVDEGAGEDVTLGTIQEQDEVNVNEGSSLKNREASKEDKKKQKKKKYILKGGASALAIQLFGINDRFEMRSVDFLPAVFQLFPEHDYLVLTQPSSMADFPLLQMFTHVAPQSGAIVSQELFVLHKCSLLHSFSVHHVRLSDIEGISLLIAGLEGSDKIISDVTQYTQAKRDPNNEGGTPISAVVAKCSDQVVGVAVVRTEEDIAYIRSHYNIEDFIYFSHYRPSEHARLSHFILNPVFAPYGKHMIKELLRLSSKSCLYYPIHSQLSQTSQHTLATCLSALVPVFPRRQLVYPNTDFGINQPLPEITDDKLPYALYHTNRKLTLEPKLSVSSRLVVVGCSDTALSLLEHLIFNPHLHFLNIVLVSPYGIVKAPPTGLAQSCCYFEESLSLIGLPTWVTVIRGRLTGLDRSNQTISVQSSKDEEQSTVLPYDYLVLATGLQYQIPQFVEPLPRHTFTVNDHHQEEHLLHWVREKLAKRDEGDLVVYGGGLDAYSMLRAMLQEGFPAERLVLVLPESSSPAFPNQEIADSVFRSLEKLGVKVLSGLELIGMEVGDDGHSLSSLELSSGAGEGLTSLPSAALVYLHHKQVDEQVFKAVNDAYLVFDNRLVISTGHSTNDPLIFAAGPLTKFSRKYRVGEWAHCQFNSCEVGEKLALTLLAKLDPTVEGQISDDTDLLPRYNKPKVLYATLPGGMCYLLVHKPRIDQEQNIQKEPSHNLITRSQQGYFRVCVNQYGCIGEIEILSQGPLRRLSNYLCLYNIREKYLNNLVQRYNDQLINDFFEYFDEPWACAVFHDRFTDFVDEVREHLSQLPAKDGDTETLEECVKSLVEEDSLSPLTIHRPSLKAQFDNSPVKNFIHHRLFKYLHYNSQHLTMYGRPDMM